MTNNDCSICIRQLNQNDAGDIQGFWNLGLAYMEETANTPEEVNKRFLRSILSKSFGDDRWLLLLLAEKRYLGFVHAKIDFHERIEWGYILEFYIVPEIRRKGYGSILHRKIVDIFIQNGLGNIWLTSDPKAEHFWQTVGFYFSGEEENGRKVMYCNT